MAARDVGVTVLPEFFQNEGAEAVLDNLVARAEITAVATSPYVMAPVADGQGSREPPIDAGAGKVRLLDRPLWGRRELFVRTAPSYAPDRSLYAGLRYQPAEPDALTKAEGAVVARAIEAAKARGLAVHLQVQAAIPPGYRVQFGGPVEEDRPCLPDGTGPAVRVDNNGSLASPHILAYTKALIRDLVRAYPDIDALRIDWPEYPPYSLDALFFDFSPHAVAAMAEHGFDPERIRHDVATVRERVTKGLGGQDLARVLAVGFDGAAARRLLDEHPGVRDWLAAKAGIVTRFIAACAATLREASGGRIGLVPQAFPPPWCWLSGFDYRAVAGLGVEAIGTKLYSMHWPMMVRAYGDALAQANPGITDDPRLGPAIAKALDIADDPMRYAPLGAVRYPEPEEPHPVGAAAQARKVALAQAEAGAVPVYAFAHGYGPVEDFAARATVAFEAAHGRLWVNRYGYLSDEKIDALGRLGRGVDLRRASA